MKKNWTLLVGALLLSTLALTACGKKGGGGAATPPGPGADGGPTQPGQPVQTNKGQWGGYIETTDKQLLKQLLKQTRSCQGNCRFEGLYLSLRINENQLPGQGSFMLRTYDYNQWSNYVQWKYSLNKFSVAIPLNNGFQFNYNVNGGGWHGGGDWWHRPNQPRCYWREIPSQGSPWWAQLQINGNGGSLNIGAGNRTRYEYYCEEVTHMMQAQNAGQQQNQMAPQVVDPQVAQSMQHQFWAGHQVQITAEYKDASKTCLIVKIYFKGQMVAQGEINGVVYP